MAARAKSPIRGAKAQSGKRSGGAGAVARKAVAAEGKVAVINPNTGRVDLRIDAEKYAAVRMAVLKSVPRSPGGIGFSDLLVTVPQHLPGGEIPGGGKVAWYVTTVKLDLEARGELLCDRESSPQKLSRPKRS